MAERDIKVKFSGDSNDLERAAKDAGTAVDKSGKAMAGGMSSLVGPATIAMGAIAGVGAVVMDMTQAAMEDQAAQETLAANLRNFAGASEEAISGAEEYISLLSQQAAIADDELRPALARLTSSTHDVRAAQKLLKLSTDISAATGKDLESVVNAVAKAQDGSTGALKKLGVQTEDAQGKALSFAQVVELAGQKYGGMAEVVAGTGAGKLRNAQIQFDELKEQIGMELLPILSDLAGGFTTTLLPAIQGMVAWVKEMWPGFKADFDAGRLKIEEFIGSFDWGTAVTEFEIGSIIVADTVDGLASDFEIGSIEVAAFIDSFDWGTAVTEFEIGSVIVADTVDGLASDFELGAVQVAAFIDSIDWGQAVTDFKNGWTEISTTIDDFVNGLKRIWDWIQSIKDLWDSTVGKLSIPSWMPFGAGMSVPSSTAMAVPMLSASAMGTASSSSVASGGITFNMPPGSDGYTVARQLRRYDRTVGALNTTVAFR